MTILDKLLQYDPSGTAITATAVSTNVLDQQQARDLSRGGSYGRDPQVQVAIITTLTAAGAATLTIQSQGSIDNASWTVMAQTDAIPKANLVAGTVITLPLGNQQPQSAGIPRYYRLNYVVATGPFTGGTIESDLVWVTPQENNPPTYPPGIVIAN